MATAQDDQQNNQNDSAQSARNEQSKKSYDKIEELIGSLPGAEQAPSQNTGVETALINNNVNSSANNQQGTSKDGRSNNSGENSSEENAPQKTQANNTNPAESSSNPDAFDRDLLKKIVSQELTGRGGQEAVKVESKSGISGVKGDGDNEVDNKDSLEQASDPAQQVAVQENIADKVDPLAKLLGDKNLENVNIKDVIVANGKKLSNKSLQRMVKRSLDQGVKIEVVLALLLQLDELVEAGELSEKDLFELAERQ